MIEIKIKGMACEGCVSHVKENLEKWQGVTKVEVSLEPPLARIEGISKEEVPKILEKIQSLGYEGEIVKE